MNTYTDIVSNSTV